MNTISRNPYLRGRLSTVDLLVLTSLDQLNFILKIIFTFFNEEVKEVNCTEFSPSVSVPWLKLIF
jgi:hypothetical protein